ncbi:MAG TPA: hypothetical protein VK946_03035 [Methylotenera sp.]|nr:hypothetical protein [Methylotenera sp.]
MKHLAAAALMLTGFSFAHFAIAEEVPANQTIPTAERDFVKAINGFDKAKIIAQFGEPAKAEDVKIKDTTKVVASIWHYHYINTAPDGSYYQTTELDFIDDKVVMVVFMNNDGSESQGDVKRYEMPDGEMPPAMEPQL